jgi:hypothetical protein
MTDDDSRKAEAEPKPCGQSDNATTPETGTAPERLPARQPNTVTRGGPEKLPPRTPSLRTLTQDPDPRTTIQGPPQSLNNDEDSD